MHKLIALYTSPENPEEFDRAYRELHMPAVAKMPHLRRLEVNRVTGAPLGEPPYYLIAEMWFDTREQMMESVGSEEGRAAAATLREFARGLVSMVYAETEERE